MLSGFALGRHRHGALRVDEAYVFEEVWGPCEGVCTELGAPIRKDLARTEQFKILADSVGRSQTVVLRAASDNQFAHMIARTLKAKWVNSLVIAERKLTRKAGVSIPAEYRLRMFENRDEFHISRIHKQAFKETISIEDYRAWATAANCRTIIATYDRKPVGFIIAEKRSYASLGDFTIAVKPTHQNKGVGYALLQTALNIFIDIGVSRVVADYLMLNASAHNLYRKLGFKPKRTYDFFVLKKRKPKTDSEKLNR